MGRTQHHLTHQTSVCGGSGQRFIPHIWHQPVEGMHTALSHTSGISLWRRWAPHYPTHRASARGGDGHRVLPHIGQTLPGSGRLLCNGWVAPLGSSPHDHKRVLLCIHPRSFAAGRGQSPWFAISMGTGRERHLCFHYGHAVPGSAVFIARMWLIGTNNYRSSLAQGLLP